MESRHGKLALLKRLTTIAVYCALGVCTHLTYAQSVTLTHLVRGTAQDFAYYERVASEFTKAFPEIQIKLDHVSPAEYSDKLTLMVASGTQPDTTWANPGSNFWLFMHRGYFMDLWPHVERSDIDVDSYFPGVLDLASDGGALYGLPFQVHPGLGGMLTNHTLFDQAGLAYPNENWTYEGEFLDAVRRLTADTTGDGVPDRWGTAMALGRGGAATILYSMGGRIIDDAGEKSMMTSPESVNAVEFLHRLTHEFRANPRPGEGGVRPLWEQGNLGMTLQGPWTLAQWSGNVDFDWKIYDIPLGDVGRIGSEASLDMHVIMNGTAHPDEAFEWVKYLSSGDALLHYFEFKSNLVIVASLNQVLVDRFPGYDAYIRALVNRTYRLHPRPRNFRTLDVWTTLNRGLRPVWEGTMDVRQALEQLDHELNTLLAEDYS